jgi:CBS domain-containing membrane protein
VVPLSGQYLPASAAKGKALPPYLPDWLRQGRGKTISLALFAFLGCGISTAVLAALAHWSHSPLIFPSLGPAAFRLFHRSLAASASPRNTVMGHLIAILAGWLSLALMGLTDSPSVLEVGVTWPHVVAATLSISLTSGLAILFHVPHPPAGATALILSLGLFHDPWKYPILMAGIVLLLLLGLVINRLAGIPYPLWHPVDAETKKQYAPAE